jgi:SAM-dependent methyltransferase
MDVVSQRSDRVTEVAEVAGWSTESWVTDSVLNGIAFSSYWNDEQKEKQKQWYILDGDFSRMETYLSKTRLPDDIRRGAELLRAEFGRTISGTGLDMAAGNLWAVPQLLQQGAIDKLYCLEYSKHRLLTLGPRVLDHYNVPRERVVLALGSFYDIHLADESLDFVFLSQAFHHADDPERLLAEICRVLKPRGLVMIIGEHIVERSYVKHLAAAVVSRVVPTAVQRLAVGRVAAPRPLLPEKPRSREPDPIMGDHYYTAREYQRMFAKRFTSRPFRTRRSSYQSFILVRRA